MIALIIFFMSILSGSFLFTSKNGRRLEEFLPITNLSVVMVLYLFGLIGILEYGVWAILAIIAAIYAYIGYVLVKRHKPLRNFLSPLLAVFILLFVVLIYANFGMLATAIDEMSHWMECVKSMSFLNDFNTNSKSHDYYNSYPPGMALLQYYV